MNEEEFLAVFAQHVWQHGFWDWSLAVRRLKAGKCPFERNSVLYVQRGDTYYAAGAYFNASGAAAQRLCKKMIEIIINAKSHLR